MRNIYLYIENQSSKKIKDSPFRIDTPNQQVSNISYLRIKEEIEKFGYNFDFLGRSKIEENDILIISNLQFFSRNIFLKILIHFKRKLLKMINNKDYIEVKIKNWKKMSVEGRLIPYLWESRAVQTENWNYKNHVFFKKILTWDTNYQDNIKYFPCYLQAGPLYLNEKEIDITPKPELRKIFLSAISHNKITFNDGELYLFRYELFNWLGINQSDDFELYGGGWNGDPEYVGENPYNIKNIILYKNFTKKYKKMNGIKYIYKGVVDNKNKILEKSKFSLCIENSGNSYGYLTEKFFDCLKAGSIPVYLGAPNIRDLVPENIFIDIRKFNYNFNSLYKYLREIDSKSMNIMQENGLNFLRNSSLIRNYLPENIAKQIISAIEN